MIIDAGMMAGPNVSSDSGASQHSVEMGDTSSDAEGVTLDEVCEDDRCKTPNSPIWHCVDCDSNYCSECWAYQGPHKAGKFGRDGEPHERMNVKVFSRLKKILQPLESPDLIKKSHETEQCTKWFGKYSAETMQ